MLSRIIRSPPLQNRFFSENLKTKFQKIDSLDLMRYYMYSWFIIGSGSTVYNYHIEFKDRRQEKPFSTALISLTFGILEGFSWPMTLIIKGSIELDKMYQHHIKDITKK